ncbi:MAG: thioredoxin family protein [Sulfitobacter sp.]
MDRRHFITCAAATVALPSTARAYEAKDFNLGMWGALQATDQTIILFFRADWSLTCQITSDLIDDLLAENPGFALPTFVDVNWDIYGPSEFAKQMQVTRRSTLIVMKNGEEQARLVNEPFEHRVRALLETALSAE